MLQTLSTIIPIVVLGIIVWRRGRDPRAGSPPTAQWLRLAGLVLFVHASAISAIRPTIWS
jgi:hypothetical protein